MSAPPLRMRVATHTQAIKGNTNQTELSAKAKELKSKGTSYKLEFHLIENTPSYKPETKRCGLCTAEIYHILYGGYENLLNSKNEINNKCRHKNKYKIGAG